MEQSETKEYYLGRMEEMKSKGNAIGGIAWFLGLDLGLSLSRASINRGTLVFFVRLVWLLVLEALFSKLRFRTIGHMKSHPGPSVLPARPCLWCVFVVVTW